MPRPDVELFNIGDDQQQLADSISTLQKNFDSHIHDGTSSKGFETLTLETLLARVVSIRKKNYSDNTAGVWTGLDGNTPKINIGDATSYLKFNGSTLSIAGSITATTGTIGGWTLGSTTIKSATTGERIELDAGNTNLNLINSTGSTVVQFDYGTTETSPILNIHVQDERRIGLEITTDNITGSGESHSLQIYCRSNDTAVEGFSMVRSGANNSETLYGAYIKATNTGSASSTALALDATVGIEIVSATVGLDLNGCTRIFSVGANATDPTGGGGAAAGRIPISVGGNLKYLAYY